MENLHNSPELSLQEEIDKELSRYESLTKQILELEEDVSKKMRTYEDILNSYLNAIKIIQPKMDSWRTPRREKVSKMCSKLSQKWSDTRSAVNSDPSLNQDEQIFLAVLRIHYKKPAEQQAFQKKRQKLIFAEIAKMVPPH